MAELFHKYNTGVNTGSASMYTGIATMNSKESMHTGRASMNIAMANINIVHTTIHDGIVYTLILAQL